MADYNVTNIIVGAADVYVSASDSTSDTWAGGPALPAFVGGTGFSDTLGATADWRFLGLTSGGIEFTYSPDFGSVEVDQMLDDAKLFKQKQTATVATNLPEATLENLLLAWGQQNSTLDSLDAAFDPETTNNVLDISAGELGDEPVERAIAFVGPAPRTPGGLKRERVYNLKRCLQVESSAHALNRAEATMIPVSFRCLPGSDSKYGQIVDRIISLPTTP